MPDSFFDSISNKESLVAVLFEEVSLKYPNYSINKRLEIIALDYLDCSHRTVQRIYKRIK